MKAIAPPLNRNSRGAEVTNLQDGLLLLLRRQVIQVAEDDRRSYEEELLREQREQTYNDVTQKVVAIFQEQQRLNPIEEQGSVDAVTAEALNRILRELGALDQPGQPANLSRIVSGRIIQSNNQPFVQGGVRAFHHDGQNTIRLGGDTTDAEGHYTIRYEELPGVDVINLRVVVLNGAGETAIRSEIVQEAKSLEVIDLVVPFVSSVVETRQMEGRIVFDHGLPTEGTTLRLYQLGFGGAEGARLLKETTTQEHGLYNLTYSTDQASNLEIRALDAGGQEIALSKLIKNADKKEILNLVLPATAKPMNSEFERLAVDLQPHVGNLNRLAMARETVDRPDLTLLHEATGWDARLIALAATATKLSAADQTGLPQNVLYGLLRAGLPADKLQLARVGSEAFGQALNKAVTSDIITLNETQITQAKETFENFSVNTRLAVQIPGSNTTYSDLLSTLNLNETDQKTFAKLYLDHQGDAKSLWDAANDAGLRDAVPKLQMQGKLAFLTTNNPTLTTSLQQELGNGDPSQLVQRGLYKKEAWLNRITMVPSAYRDANNPKDAYAEDMARRVRISYPTEVTWNMIETGELQIEGGNANLSVFLRNAVAKGFKLGQTPIESFIKANPDVFDGIAANDQNTTKEMIKTLQRVYQITPGNDAMKALMNAGLLSAQDVLAYPLDVFLDRFGELFPSLEQARLVYRKAEQVSNLTYSIFSLAKELDNTPPLAVTSAPIEVRETVKTELIKHFPTMESLFGSMDYCECEQCRSVLSPAAYLVDLFQFIDRAPKIWENTLQDWQKKHGGAPYPFQNPAAFTAFQTRWNERHPGEPIPNTKRTPYEILIEQRPDLPHIQLTCENTNTALPHIDLVNEILEYYVANNALTDKTARDTGEATTAELLAEPQYVIAEAYTTLQQAHYPLALPFDLWSETVRAFCNYFEVPLWQLLETFSTHDELFAPEKVYDRAATFLESLNLSPAEIALYSDSNPLLKWFDLYGFATEAAALTEAIDEDSGQRIDLNSAKALSRRLGVSYKELVDIIKTGFVNPALAGLVTLHKLKVSATDVFFYQQYKNLLEADEQQLSPQDRERLVEIKAFEQRLDGLTDKYKKATPDFNARNWLQEKLQNNAFDPILVLADPEAGCNFDQTILRYANDRKVDAIALLKINLFVRLWRKLGWSIEETDRALQTFIPTNAPFQTENLDKQPLKTALIYMAHLSTLATKLQVGKETRLKLLTLWADLSTTGENTLYRQLFLKRNILQSDPIFDHPLGQYLSDPNVLINAHLPALQGALGLTATEIRDIFQENGQDIATASLSLSNVSLLYRYKILAKALKLSVSDLIALKQLSGLNPFQSLSADPLTQLQDDHPFTQTLHFVELSEKIKSIGLTISDLNYWLRHQFDPTGKYRSNTEAMLSLTKNLATGIGSIRSEHAIPTDPSTLNEESLRQKMGLILPSPVVEKFWAMMNGTIEFTAIQPGVTAVNQLQIGIFVGERSISQLVYNATKQEQKLSFRGILFDNQKTELKEKFLPQLAPDQQAIFTSLLDKVQAEGREQANDFFTQNLQEKPLNDSISTGFLKLEDFDKLFEPIPTIRDDLPEDQKLAAMKANDDKVREKRARLATVFLPFLQCQLIRQLVVQTMTSTTQSDAGLIELLLTNKSLLQDPTQTDQSLLDAFATTDETGVSVSFYASVDGKSDLLETRMLKDIDTTLVDTTGNVIKPAGTNSARVEGYLEVPNAGAYRFFARLSQPGAEAKLSFAHLPNPVFIGQVAQANDELGNGATEFVELKPGIPYRFTLELNQLNGGDAQLQVQGETLPKGKFSRLTLYAETSVERSRRAQVLLNKVLQLIQTLGFNEHEVRYILTHKDDFDHISLTQLPTRAEDDTPVQAIALFQQFMRLVAYASLKRELEVESDDLIAVFEATTLDDAYRRMGTIMRREPDRMKATTEALFPLPAFANEVQVQRLWEALQIVETFGVSVADLQRWTAIVKPATTPIEHQQRSAIAQDLKSAIKARFELEAWQRVAQPIFDKLRQRQRDALVAHVMHQRKFDRIEQLFEYFLIDPGVEPVVQTSRIRSAIAAVQIFIHRCLLNLEPQVAPSAINSKQWQWMKRYPVWAGNRKLWLFPENVLEPEFRDDKTHLFKELEGALLQGDVNNDLVEDAFFKYLKKLDEIARLDIVGMYCEEQPLDPASNQLHVIGRNHADPPKYFYRRYAHQMWTPWEPMPVEIQGDHIVPVMWRDRLNLFWVTFMDTGDPEAAPMDGSDQSIFITEATVKATTKAFFTENRVTKALTGSSNNQPKKVTEMTVGQLSGQLRSAVATKLVKIQLHWSEYFQGEWSAHESSEFKAALTKSVPMTFDSTSVFIHATKEYDPENGEERAVKIHLGGEINKAFRLVSRNSSPRIVSREAAPSMPYNASTVKANRYQGSGAFKVSFIERIRTEDGKKPELTLSTPNILQQGGEFTLLSCANTITLSTPEIASLVSPVFYQDDQGNTFFVEPTFKEKTIEEWQEWVTRVPVPEVERHPKWWETLPLEPRQPVYKFPIPTNPGDPIWRFKVDDRARFALEDKLDWLANPITAVQFDGELIGPVGRAELVVQSSEAEMAVEGATTAININAGSAITTNNLIVTRTENALAAAQLTQAAGGLNVIGSNGLNSALLKNINALKN